MAPAEAADVAAAEAATMSTPEAPTVSTSTARKCVSGHSRGDRGSRRRADAYHSHPRPARAIDQHVQTDFVVDVCDVDLRCRQSLQGLGYIAGPDAPCGTVSEFHQMAPIVFLDLHRRSPV
jgi:hypothetical protein